MIFKANASANPGIKTTWRTDTEGNNLLCAIPTCFGGSGDGLSPEDFLAEALSNCFIGTFKVIAQNSKFDFSKLSVSTILEIDRTSGQNYKIKRAIVEVKLEHAQDHLKAASLLRLTQKAGIILNSVSFPVEYREML